MQSILLFRVFFFKIVFYVNLSKFSQTAGRLAATCQLPMPSNEEVQRKWAEESGRKSAGALMQAGTFQTRLHKSQLWQLISNSHSTCPDTSARRMCFPTRALPTPIPRLHPSVSNPLDLLFITIAAAACAPTRAEHACHLTKKTKKNAQAEIWSCWWVSISWGD